MAASARASFAAVKPRSGAAPLGLVLLTLYLDLVGFSIVFPIYAELLQHYGGAPGGLLGRFNALLEAAFGVGDPHRHAAFFGGVLTGLYSLLQFLVTPFWGSLSDRIGRRPVLLITIALNAAGYLVWAFAGAFELFILSRLVAALASSNISVASAAVADISVPERRARSMGLMGAAVGLGFLTGPAIGGAYVFLPRLDAPGGAAPLALNPFSTPALIAFALSAFNLLSVLWRFGETLPAAKRGAARSFRSANPFALFHSEFGPVLPRLNLVYLLFMTAFAGFEATMVFLATDRLGWGPGDVGVCMIWVGFCSAAIQGGAIRRVVDRFGERRLALAGLAFLIPAYLLVALVARVASGPLFYTGATLLAAGIGFLSPTLTALVSFAAPPTAQGQVMGSYRSVGALGRALGPLLAALLYFGAGAGAPYLAAATLSLPALLLLFALRTPPRPAAGG